MVDVCRILATVGLFSCYIMYGGMVFMGCRCIKQVTGKLLEMLDNMTKEEC